MRWSCLTPLMMGLLILSGCAQAPAHTPSPTLPTTVMAQTERIVEVEAQGIVLHYQAEEFWSEDEWSGILENEDEFSSDLMGKFIDDLSKHGEGDEETVNASVEFNEGRKSTILRCDIRGAVWKSGNSHHATFFWLLRPLGLDFIDNDFEESEKGLFWEGFVNGVPTTVTIELPTIEGFVYEAWGHPVGHCHAHVWWELSQ